MRIRHKQTIRSHPIKFLMICMQRKGGQQAGFLTPLWVIRSAMGFGLQLGWGGLSAASSLPGGSDKRPLRQIILSPLESVYWFTSKYLWDGYHSSSGWIWEIWIVCKCCLVNTPHGIFNKEPLMGLLWKWNRNLGKKNNTHQCWYLSCYALCSDQKPHLYLINK